jgi:predicted nucleic acid-binding protein
MPFVLDASVAAAWLFPDEEGTATQAAVRLVDDTALVPALFWFEIRNVLLVGERRGRIGAADTARFLARLDGLPLEVDHAASSAVLLDLARTRALSAYDAAYLELAHRRAASLATLDRRLAAAATAEGVGLIGAS